MTLPFSDELISAYLDGELTAQEQEYVEEQLRDNAELRRMCDELRSLRVTLQAMPVATPPENLAERVLRQAERRMLAGDDEPVVARPAGAGTAADAPSMAQPQRFRHWRVAVVFAATLAASVLATLWLPPREARDVASAPASDFPAASDRAVPESAQPAPTTNEEMPDAASAADSGPTSLADLMAVPALETTAAAPSVSAAPAAPKDEAIMARRAPAAVPATVPPVAAGDSKPEVGEVARESRARSALPDRVKSMGGMGGMGGGSGVGGAPSGGFSGAGAGADADAAGRGEMMGMPGLGGGGMAGTDQPTPEAPRPKAPVTGVPGNIPDASPEAAGAKSESDAYEEGKVPRTRSDLARGIAPANAGQMGAFPGVPGPVQLAEPPADGVAAPDADKQAAESFDIPQQAYQDSAPSEQVQRLFVRLDQDQELLVKVQVPPVTMLSSLDSLCRANQVQLVPHDASSGLPTDASVDEVLRQRQSVVPALEGAQAILSSRELNEQLQGAAPNVLMVNGSVDQIRQALLDLANQPGVAIEPAFQESEELNRRLLKRFSAAVELQMRGQVAADGEDASGKLYGAPDGRKEPSSATLARDESQPGQRPRSKSPASALRGRGAGEPPVVRKPAATDRPIELQVGPGMQPAGAAADPARSSGEPQKEDVQNNRLLYVYFRLLPDAVPAAPAQPAPVPADKPSDR